jgi:hypothetical protein
MTAPGVIQDFDTVLDEKQVNLVEVPAFEDSQDLGWDMIKDLLTDRSVSFEVACYPTNSFSLTV